MAQQTKQEIINDIANHFSTIPYRSCYFGITSNVQDRLFGDHNVSEKTDHWIYRTAATDTVAREIEKHFLNLGMDGGGGGGDASAKIVYAYKKNGHTKP